MLLAHLVGHAGSDEFSGVPVRAHFFNFRRFTMKYSRSGTGVSMSENTIERGAAEIALAFGSTIRRRRKALDMRQDELALATGVGRRFLIDLEAGKPTCQLGCSLLVADALGLKVTGLLAESLSLCAPTAGQGLPDLPDVVEEPDGQSTGIL
jgi:DNA-binding XRE family transcriptional regulator